MTIVKDVYQVQIEDSYLKSCERNRGRVEHVTVKYIGFYFSAVGKLVKKKKK